MTDRPLHFQTITELGGRIRSGELSPVALTEHLLARIEALNGPLNAFNLVTAERALGEARAAGEAIKGGGLLGPLHGIPYGVKDIFDVAGLPTTGGSRTLGDAPAEEDCEVTRRLREAGMIVLGKTITVEFAKGIVGINHIQGTPHNPWHAEPHVPGGSSAGTAVAVAAGLAPMGLGSDTGGSVRAPAGLCGTVGLKTTVGRISRHGVLPLSWTLDSVGALTRSVEDAALVYQALQGEDPRDASTLGIAPHDALSGIRDGVKGLRVGIPEEVFYEDLDPEVEKAVRAAAETFRDLGARVERVKFPEAEQAAALELAVSAVESCVIHEERLKTRAAEMDPVVGPRMVDDLRRPATEYARALRTLGELRRSMAHTLRDVDALLAPATPIPAHPTAQADVDIDTYDAYVKRYVRNTRIGNHLDLCGVVLTCGFTAKGLPVGLMIQGKPFAEDVVLRAGYAYEQATDWHRRMPELGWAE